MNQAEKKEAREYLLGTVPDATQEQVELRLLADPEYANELEMLVDEITDDYVEGKIHGEERGQVERFFFRSSERRERLNLALALQRVHLERRTQPAPDTKVTTKNVRRTDFRIYWPIAAGVLFLFALGVVLWRWTGNGSEVNQALLALNSAYKTERPTQSRISGLSYAPFFTTRGSEDERTNNELRRAELTLLDALEKRPSPVVHHALGQVYLAKRQFDSAIKEFDEALKADPNNAVLHSDLGAAWLEKGKIDRSKTEPGKNVEALARSLEHLDRALELNPNLAEALFNRGIVHQQLQLWPDAERDWQEYLKKDPSSGWSDDARRYLKELEEEKRNRTGSTSDLQSDLLVASQMRDATRMWELIRRSRQSATPKRLGDQLLDQYLSLSANGEENKAQEILRAVMFVGEVELKETQDLYTSELAKLYASTSPRQREVLRNARELMALGQRHHGESKPAEALAEFEKSKKLFREVGNVLEADVAEMWIGFCHLNAANTERSIEILSRLVAEFNEKKYRWLHMRALHLLSGAEYNFSEYSRAIDHNRRVFSIAEEIGDLRAAFNAISILIEQYRHIGNFQQALDCIQRSLALINLCKLSDGQIAQHFSIVAAALSSSELYRAAAAYQEEALELILTIGERQLISRAYANLGTIYGKLGRYDEALQRAQQGYETAKSLPDESVRRRMMAYTSLRVGDLYLQSGNTSKAIETYRHRLDLHQSVDSYYGLYEAHKNLLFAYIAENNDQAAGAEIKTTLDLINKYRSKILESDNRNNFFGIEQGVYDLAINFEYSRAKNSEKAFQYSEDSRARSLLDLVKSKGNISTDKIDKTTPDIIFQAVSQPLSFSDIRQKMPEKTQIVQYSVLHDKILIWFISKTDSQTFASPVTQQELEDKVTSFLTVASDGLSPPEDGIAHAKQLFEWLIKPVESLLEKDRVIYFVPDKVLNYLPFNALVSSQSNRYLIQDYSIATSPSSTLLVTCSEAAQDKNEISKEKILSVGNPTFGSSYVSVLADLPAAKREAEEVARFYETRSVLTREDATKPVVEREMTKANVIHFAVHSVLNPRLPLRSKLILAEQQKGESEQAFRSDDLEAHDIHKLKLSNTRLVVLSACESGIGKYHGGEGMMNLARPFLAANVPLVVVSLWPVDSDVTAELMINFHRYRKQDKSSTVEALRRAQLDLLDSGDTRSRKVYSWASFVTVGGWASF